MLDWEGRRFHIGIFLHPNVYCLNYFSLLFHFGKKSQRPTPPACTEVVVQGEAKLILPPWGWLEYRAILGLLCARSSVNPHSLGQKIG